MAKQNTRARKANPCIYCRQVRFTRTGLFDHIKQMHPDLITPGGILLPNTRTDQIIKNITLKV